MLFDVHSGNSANLIIYENVAITANTGNAVTPLNVNRIAGDSSLSVVKSQATLNATGAVTLFSGFTGQPGHNNSAQDTGGSTGERHEWILKPSTNYAIVLTETGSVAQLMNVTLDWYEHVPNGV